MKLVVGGAFQGKLAYAGERYVCPDNWADGRVCSEQDLETCAGVYRFHEFIRRKLKDHTERDAAWELRAEADAAAFAEHLLQANPNLIVVSDELGYGIVPMDPFEREYRETVGRICTELAARADEVVRVVSGIGMVIKPAQN